ncbi:MAG: HNH endonuclease signature motif containing protein [bacterium]|nr:HNH endonuclease signature motif containing protein [bacterium]
MSIIESLRPFERNRIYDMVYAAGVDVSDWDNSKKGKVKNPAANPKYCYNWSFVEPGKVVVLNLWHDDLKEQDGDVTDEWNAREIAERGRSSVTKARAMAMDHAIQLAFKEKLPIRVVLCEGTKRNRNDPDSAASKVSFRFLDSEPWHVARYESGSGQCTLMRGLGGSANRYVDQFDMPVPEGGPAQKVPVKGSTHIRRPEVRRFALDRANGKCEYCGAVGFTMTNGQVYLETHHVVPLHEQGPDSVGNVVALCPNHHREAHHGNNRVEIRKKLQHKLASLAPNNSLQARRP